MTPGRYRVLLVEDNELDARAMSRALSRDGECEVERVTDLSGAMRAIEHQAFDCVLLDLSLPDSDGLVSVETMVAASPHCPVVVLTGLDDPEIAVVAVERGAQDYLVKGTITADLVARAIRYAVARHAVEVELLAAQTRLDTMHAREQIARDLHDTVIQRLFATGMSLQAAASLPDRDEVAARARGAVDQIDDAIRELREAIFGLHAHEQDDSIAAEVASIAHDYAEVLGTAPVVRTGAVAPVSSSVRQDIIAVLTEALSNVARHADAARVTVSLDQEGDQGRGRLVLRVFNDGTSRVPEVAPDRLGGNGLRNMRIRAEAHGGSMAFTSNETTGTELVWSIPLDG